jgi:suppressor of ftsI
MLDIEHHRHLMKNARYLIIAVAIAGISLFISTRDSKTRTVNEAPRASSAQFDLVELKDGDTYDLTIAPLQKKIGGRMYPMLAYNGSIPGPLIKVVQGSEIVVNLKNDMDMETTLHPHGVRVENRFDGIPDVTQKAIQPGETYTYKLKFPDAGMYWYHPHVREDYQQDLGLYGNFLVTPTDADYWSPVNREVPLFLDDVLIEGGRMSVRKEGADHVLMGKYGDTMLVNGETDLLLTAKKGEVVRFYITNSANARPFNIAVPGVKMKLVGADGGAYEKDAWVDGVTVSPSERVIVEMHFEKTGTFSIENATPEETTPLAAIEVSDKAIDVSYAAEFADLRAHEETSRSIERFRKDFDNAPDKRIAFTLDMAGSMAQMPGMGHGAHQMPDGSMMGGSMMSPPGKDGIEWEYDNSAMNRMSTTSSVKWKLKDLDTGKENMDIMWSFKKDVPVKIRIFNDPSSMHPMQHPFHMHGQRFLVLSIDGVPETNLVWKDTVLVPSGRTIDILLDPSNPGTWMAHCHIAEHLESGMMLMFDVKE